MRWDEAQNPWKSSLARAMPSQTLASGTRELTKFPVYCGRVTKTRDGGRVGEGVGFISYINLVSPRYYVLVVQLSSACIIVFILKTVA